MAENYKTVTDIIDDVKNAMCNDYCRYPKEWDEEKEGIELYLSDICENCPINKL